MHKHDPDNVLNNVLESFSGLVGKDGTLLEPKDSSSIDINQLVNDHIYGLLTKEQLSASQLTLLTALLQYRN